MLETYSVDSLLTMMCFLTLINGHKQGIPPGLSMFQCEEHVEKRKWHTSPDVLTMFCFIFFPHIFQHQIISNPDGLPLPHQVLSSTHLP